MGSGASIDGGGTSGQDDSQQTGRTHRSAPQRRTQGFQEVEIRPSTDNNMNRNFPTQENSGTSSVVQPNHDGVEYKAMYKHLDKQEQQQKSQEKREPKYGNDDIVFETFFHHDGSDYTCLYQNGERYYMQWQNGNWLPFPPEWYNKGLLVTDSKVEDDSGVELNTSDAELCHVSSDEVERDSSTYDDRAGTLQHPKRGMLSTYLFEEKRNVHYFFDDESGTWLKLPIAWELHSDKVDLIIQQICDIVRQEGCSYIQDGVEELMQSWDAGGVRPTSIQSVGDLVSSAWGKMDEDMDALPVWEDKHDMLSALRACNYDQYDCIDNYLTVGDQKPLACPRNISDAKQLKTKDNKIKELENQVNRLNKLYEHVATQLSIAHVDNSQLQEEIYVLQGRLSEQEASSRQTRIREDSLRAELVRLKPEFAKVADVSNLHQVVLHVLQKQEEKLRLLERRVQEEKILREEAEEKMRENVLYREPKKTEEHQVQMSSIQEGLMNEQRKVHKLEQDKLMLEQQLQQERESSKLKQADAGKLKVVCAVAKELQKSNIKLKLSVQSNFNSIAQLCSQALEASSKIDTVRDSAAKEEVEQLRALYRKEALQRKLLFNQLQDLRGNIRVFARCRKDLLVDCCMEFPSEEELVVRVSGSVKRFEFNRVFGPDTSQKQVFEDTLPIVTSCVDGYNVCILAYGQTGSGKTHTMMGPSSDPGVNIRAIQELLRITSERSQVEYTLKVSMVEIYNENVIDLLTPGASVLNVQSNGNQVKIVNLRETVVRSLQDIHETMETGMENRHTAATKMNSQSSRSHLLVILVVEGVDRASGMKSRGTLTLCDLAGSERVGKTEATGQRLVEAAAINKSLTSLGQVFSSLRSGQLHVPYRNSKLTHILQPSLGGDAKACLFVMVSPAESNLSETISTLTFGSNARQVQLGQAKANVEKRVKKK